MPRYCGRDGTFSLEGLHSAAKQQPPVGLFLQRFRVLIVVCHINLEEMKRIAE